MKRKSLKIPILIFFLLFSTFGLITPVIGSPDLETSRTYTLDADFDDGTLVGVEHETVHDQLQLSKEHVTLPFIWVPNLQGTVSKVNTSSGKELGRYWVAPYAASPSRTTVDLEGNCWVGNRQAGTVVKIGLYEAGEWRDHNGDGEIQTSRDSNNDGQITGGELLPWGEDECVLFEVLLREGYEGTYTPGTIDSWKYDSYHWGTSPRGLAVDEFNNLWAGTYYNCRYYYIDGDTGAILRKERFYQYVAHAAYGAVIDENGILWSAGRPTQSFPPHIIRFDPDLPFTTTSPINPEKIFLYNLHTYGLGLDYLGHLFVSGWAQNKLHRLDTNRPLEAPFPSSIEEWSKWGPDSARGVTCTSDNDVWVASTSTDKVYRFWNNGTQKAEIPVGDGPTGVSVDADGNVWVCNLLDDTIQRINNETNAVDKTVNIVGSGFWTGVRWEYHYSYSDMTGIMARTITTQIGTWTVDFDSGGAGTPWGKIWWNSEESVGTSLTVQVRSSEDQVTWSSWEVASNDVPLSSTPDGKYLQIETTLQILEGEVSPILFDLTVNPDIIPAEVDFDPDTLNRKSEGKWVTVYIELPGGYDVNNIEISTILFNGLIQAEEHPTSTDGGILMVKFNRSSVINILTPGLHVEITITGLIDGTPFEGTDEIRVIYAPG